MSNILLGKKIKSDGELSYQQGSQTINQTNVVYGNVGLNDQQQAFQITPLASFNTEIDQNPGIQGIRDWVFKFLKRTTGNSMNVLTQNFDLIDNEYIKKLYSEGEKCEKEGANTNDIKNLKGYIDYIASNVSYIKQTISFIKDNKNLLDVNSIGFLNNALETRTNIEYAVVSVADLIWVRKKFNENQNRKDIVLRYLGDRKDVDFYLHLPKVTDNINYILENKDLLDEESINHLFEVFSTEISRTAKGDAISETAKSISIFKRSKVLSSLEANKTNEIFPVEIRNAINFILHNQNLKIGNLTLLGSDKINSLFSVIFTPNFTIADTINTIKSVADSISKSKWLFISKALEALKNSNRLGSEENIAESVKILQENSNLIDYRDIDTLYVYSKNLQLAIASNKEEKIKPACKNLVNHVVNTVLKIVISLLEAEKKHEKPQKIVKKNTKVLLQDKNLFGINSISELSFVAEKESEELQGTVDNNINIILQNENLLNSYSINDLCSALIAKNNNRKIDSIKKSAETVVWRLLNEKK